MPEKLVTLVTEGVEATAQLIEHWAAEDGLIVTNAEPAPANTRITIEGEKMWQGDHGLTFWVADIIAASTEGRMK